MLMPKEMENVYLFFTWIISGEDNAFSGETALGYKKRLSISSLREQSGQDVGVDKSLGGLQGNTGCVC
jgi:hypothetical protein